jgi:phosphoribosylamine---glycine ligase
VKKNILIIGSGGREHALAWKIKQSGLVNELYSIPGNPGINSLCIHLDIELADIDGLKQAIIQNDINIVLCGPEGPLADGIMDQLQDLVQSHKLILIGPNQQGAQLESSKSFAKEFMSRHQIPTAAYRTFNHQEIEAGCLFMDSMNLPIVLKANGLAAGKGVLICETLDDAKTEFRSMLEGKFGDASSQVVIEEFLQGIEFSVFVLTNGEQYVILPEAKDYKRIGEGDTGLNTGGMGAISPVSFFDEDMIEKVMHQIIAPTINGLQADQIPYQGFIFFGLIKVGEDPYVIEYNCRLGDPETEAIMPRLNTDLIQLFIACQEHTLSQSMISIKTDTAATVCLVSGGYPGAFEKGKVISGHEQISQSHVFYSGTKLVNGQLVTDGGRVFAITSLGKSRQSSVNKSLKTCDKIQFEGKNYRKDIGFDLK